MQKSEMLEFAGIVATAVVDALEKKGVIGTSDISKSSKQEESVYKKTERLLYNYLGFKRVVEERKQEIEDIKKHGVPRQAPGTSEYVQKGGLPKGIVLEEESVDAAVRRIECSVHDTVQAIDLIDKCMESLKTDPYYSILEMRYFEGRTQEDIADIFGCSQVTISKNKSRLIKELSIRLFPNQAIAEMMQ